MDQLKFEELFKNFQAHCSSQNAIFDLEAFAGEASAPIVLLVHGIGGNARHWSDPSSLNVNDTWLFDLKAQPPGNINGIGSSPPFSPGSVDSWTKYLKDNKISYVNFSQAKSGGLLEFAVKEVVDLLRGLEKFVFEPYEQNVGDGSEEVPPLVILCHSRGGLVTRAALKQLGSAGVPHLRKVITLCTPHQGSYMPRLANDYNTFMHANLDFGMLGSNLPAPIHSFLNTTINRYFSDLANNVRQALLHSFGTLAQSPGFDELIPKSITLQTLERDEQPLPNVQYFSFGGSNPTFVNFFLCAAGQTIHLLSTVSPLLVDMLLDKIPGVRDNYGSIEELDKGDSAVSLTSSVWPGAFNAPHQNFHVNHMQALIDQPLQNAALQTMYGDTGGSSSW